MAKEDLSANRSEVKWCNAIIWNNVGTLFLLWSEIIKSLLFCKFFSKWDRKEDYLTKWGQIILFLIYLLFFFFFIKKMCTITSSVTVRAINTEIYFFFKEFVIQNVIKTDFVISKASHAFNLCKCTHVQCVYFYMFVLYMWMCVSLLMTFF